MLGKGKGTSYTKRHTTRRTGHGTRAQSRVIISPTREWAVEINEKALIEVWLCYKMNPWLSSLIILGALANPPKPTKSTVEISFKARTPIGKYYAVQVSLKDSFNKRLHNKLYQDPQPNSIKNGITLDTCRRPSIDGPLQLSNPTELNEHSNLLGGVQAGKGPGHFLP
ncbi:unnamed protein product [Tuber aestivum]|uniref:Uncharacterized protein n=1 Tax=Tuber aestivum TaxID=59557 RepID=A0A292PZ20_9PEZI|nr:unnamed protein product [Tuber aestivum]